MVNPVITRCDYAHHKACLASITFGVVIPGMATIGERIKQARTELGLSQEALAGKLGWPGQNRVSNYERGRDPTIADLREIARALDKPLSFFLDDEVPAPNRFQPGKGKWPFDVGLLEKVVRLGDAERQAVELALSTAVLALAAVAATKKGGAGKRANGSSGA